MRTLLVAILFLCLGYGAYTYWRDPNGSVKMVKTLASQAASQIALSQAPAAWTPPAVIPVQPNWTWTTTDGKVYHNVRIVRMDAAYVTILHSEGGGKVPLSSLPPDMQKYFNYDPASAAVATAAAASDERRAMAATSVPMHPTDHYSSTDSYPSAVAEAKTDKKLLLLHFTGSDWCPYCKCLDQQVIASSAFRDFSATNFVVVTLDFPHGFQLPPDLEQQNTSLGEKYHVSGFPTLVLTDPDGNELGRTSGYNPGSGPDAVISTLKSFYH